MRLVIFQTLTLWLLAGIGFWAAFVALGLRFDEAGPGPARHVAPAIKSYGLRAVLALGVAMGLWAGLA